MAETVYRTRERAAVARAERERDEALATYVAAAEAVKAAIEADSVVAATEAAEALTEAVRALTEAAAAVRAAQDAEYIKTAPPSETWLCQ